MLSLNRSGQNWRQIVGHPTGVSKLLGVWGNLGFGIGEGVKTGVLIALVGSVL